MGATSITKRYTRLRKRYAPSTPAVAPLQVPLGRRRKQDKDPGGVRAVTGDDLLGIDHVALGLGHLSPVFEDHPLGQQVFERLVKADQPQVLQDHGKKPRVHQVQDRMLHAADVLVHGHPAVGQRPVKGAFRRCAGSTIAQEIPRRVDEGIHGIGLALGRPPHAGRWSPQTPPDRPTATGRSAESPRRRGATGQLLLGYRALATRSHWTTGIGTPQYRCREISQSRNR